MSVTGDRALEHRNAGLVRDFFEAFGTVDRQRLAELVSPPLVWHFPGRGPISGEGHGMDGVTDGIRAIAMALGRSSNGLELHRVVASDDCAVTIHRDFYTGDDKTLDPCCARYIELVEGKMAELWEIPFDQAENDRYVAVQVAALTEMASLR